MQGDNVIERAYNYMGQLKRENATDSITIDYTKLDNNTQKIIRDSLDHAINNRKRELGQLLMGVKKFG